MSLFTPLYVLGLLAVSLPVVFHLIRRMPKGEFQFSSLMFLSPSPPRLTRRSRLEHLLLLALRALAIGLLAFAFARPFFRQSTPVEPGDGELRRIAVVVDTSASMRRGDLWQQAVAEVDAVMRGSRPLDQLALFTCDDTLRPVINFVQMSEIPAAQRAGVIRQRLAVIGPTWAGTQLGRGLMDVVEIVSNVPIAKDKESAVVQRIVLITDLQEGSRMDVLADYPWPDAVRLELRPVAPKQATNAGLHRLANREPTESAGGDAREVRVRVSNDAASAVDQFRLTWLGEGERGIGEPTSAYVPAGESRVVRVRRPPDAAASRLHLSGDGCEFDNTLYLAARPQTEISVMYLGDDTTDDPQQPRYYLERALSDGLARPVELVAPLEEGPLKLESPVTMPLVVVTAEPAESQFGVLLKYAEAGGTVLYVLREGTTEESTSAALATMLGVPTLTVSEAVVGKEKYTMLGQISFDHPLFASMAGPYFNDFTQIHFWKYRKLRREQLGGATVVANFENGHPAVMERRIGKGRVYVLTAGWQPSDSELARSWKFVLLVSALVEGRGGGTSDQVYFTVGQPVPLGEAIDSGIAPVIVKPDGETGVVADGARQFTGTDQPGLYAIESGDRVSAKLNDGSRRQAVPSIGKSDPSDTEHFAVNLDPAESRTSPLAVETLEQLGCRLVSQTAVAENDQRQRHLRDVQLESRQKLWQWLVVTALSVLVAETWLAGRVTKQALAKPVTV